MSISVPLTSAVLSAPYIFHSSFGDTWSNTWADDDNIYALSCDTKGWHEGCMPHGSNLAVHIIRGGAPYFDNLDGETINSMKTHAFDYGLWAQVKYDEDGRERMWKGNGLSCIDGVLYLTVSRHGSMLESTRYTQDAMNCSIIKSTDYGKTWTPGENENYFTPMFPKKAFSTPFFVEYGKDGKAPDGNGGWAAPPDGGDRYVYVVSNDGFWNNGNYMKLGRVPRDKVADLNAADWEFYIGNGADGLLDSNWTGDLLTITPILRANGKIGQAGIQYLQPLDRYILLQWYYPEPYSTDFNTARTMWHFYEAPKPWGPWTKFFEREFTKEGYYNPDVISKSIAYEEVSHACKMTILTAGDWRTCGEPDTIYRMTALQLTVTTQYEKEKSG